MSVNFTIEWYKQKIENVEASYKYWLGLGNYPDKEHEMEIANMKNVLAELEENQVKHGEWSLVWVDSGHLDMEKAYKCSCCGSRVANGRYEYCPWCGTKMDGGKE